MERINTNSEKTKIYAASSLGSEMMVLLEAEGGKVSGMEEAQHTGVKGRILKKKSMLQGWF